MARKPGVIGRTYTRVGSITDNTLGSLDSGIGSVHLGIQGLSPIAREFVNDSKADLTESILNLARTRKSAEAELIELGYSDVEVAEMLAPTK